MNELKVQMLNKNFVMIKLSRSFNSTNVSNIKLD